MVHVNRQAGLWFCFFFQAEDGIRDGTVTGVQTCALPIWSIVPVYQTFGGGGYHDDGNGQWVMPTAAQENQILADWAAVVPAPLFDYAYSWGPQNGDTALSQSPALRAVFAAKNARSR